ncbi:hypothetical protein [Roseitranquillus sediminis]|uniref:hypothetical protein n=1 Tax=Roseitranquillus sediminis TaxID=2809051 RepID=UPI001D0CAAFF|nr:hypothetical protein [Roseitranquillus sediminis]MBM9593429.1 hypothetical protein [Roseitranquillus sediminis]
MLAVPRAFWTLPEVAGRWGCRAEDVAAWAAAGQIEISTVVPPVVCSGEFIEGLVAISVTDVMPMFRRDGSGPNSSRVRRLRPENCEWRYITDPPKGLTVKKVDLVLTAAEMNRFEVEHSIFERRATPAVPAPVASSHLKYDWDAMWVHVLQRVHEQGLPETQREFVSEIQEWFIRRSADGDAPDERTIRRRLTPAWRTLRAEDDA